MAYVDNWSRSFKNIYLISTFDAEPDWNRFPPEINKNFNPGISWHHLARRISLHKSADVSEISASVHEEGFSLISLACSRCKWSSVGDPICLDAFAGIKVSKVWEPGSCAHPRGLQDSHQLRRDEFGALPGRVALVPIVKSAPLNTSWVYLSSAFNQN